MPEAAGYPGAEFDAEWRRLVAPADYANPRPKERYHLVVIGAGPAGLVTSIAAAGLGARVALVERHLMGGDCLNVGCVPSKALLEIGHEGADFDTAFRWLRQVRAEIAAHDSVERYTAAGVDVFLGTGRFLDAATVGVGELALSTRRVVIATGARAALPEIPGLEEAEPLTNETVFDLRAKPASIALIGGGPIGCELGQAFARLGIEVHLFEMAERLLANAPPEASRIVTEALGACGVHTHLGASIERIERRSRTRVVVHDGGETPVEQLVVAAGRRANIDNLNLAAVGVETDAGLIRVDDRLRTSNENIFAAGDVCSALKFTHNADAHARVAVQNALFLPTASIAKLVVPQCTYTNPEVAQAGLTREALEAEGRAFDVYRVAFGELDRGRTQGDEDGFAEVLTEQRHGRILGATIVGRDAGEQIAALCVAMANGHGLETFGKAVFAYPTRAEFLKRMADQYNRKKLTPLAERLFAMWFRWKR